MANSRIDKNLPALRGRKVRVGVINSRDPQAKEVLKQIIRERNEAFVHPSGFAEPVHNEPVDLRDSHDNFWESFYICCWVFNETTKAWETIGCTRVTRKAAGRCYPLNHVTKGRAQTRHPYAVFYSRAWVKKEYRRHWIHSFIETVMVLLLIQLGRPYLEAFVAPNFELLPLLTDPNRFGFKILPGEKMKDGKPVWECDFNDGKLVDLTRIELELDRGVIDNVWGEAKRIAEAFYKNNVVLELDTTLRRALRNVGCMPEELRPTPHGGTDAVSNPRTLEEVDAQGIMFDNLFAKNPEESVACTCERVA